MKNFKKIAAKELSTFFSSLAAYIFLGVFVAAALFTFFWIDPIFLRNTADVRPLFESMPVLLIFLVSAMTMRMWSEERRSGSLEFLLTCPMSNAELVFGKFAACMVLVAIALALTLAIPASVALMGPLDWGPVMGGYIATLFLASAYTSIGLFVSARTDNQIVSLISSVVVCALFLLIGSDTLSMLCTQEAGEFLRLLGAGTRFQSILRGVIDFRDLYYYLSITGIFLSLNLLDLERIRWAGNKSNSRHLRWGILTGLSIANLIVANFWLHQVSEARVDLTSGHLYSISDVTKKYLSSLKEPLLIRAYFSKRTHPYLAPLVPRMRDLLKEYALAGKGKVRLEFVDPAENPELEKEAGEQYNIRPVTFQTASKYQAALTASYFDILVKYGDEFETLNFRDLITSHGISERRVEVDLKNPEYDLTRAIKKVIYGYQAGGNPFAGIEEKVKFIGYVSPDEMLPESLRTEKKYLTEILTELKRKSEGKFDYDFVDPDAGQSGTASQIEHEFGFRPISRENGQPFWFQLTLSDNSKLGIVGIPAEPGKDKLDRSIKGALRRFTKSSLKTVSIAYDPTKQMVPGERADFRKQFMALAKSLSQNYAVVSADLEKGQIAPETDLLLVLSPQQLSEKAVFILDQFLMKGGTVVVASSPFDESMQHDIASKKIDSGLKEWFKHHGIEMKESLVLDPQDFPVLMPKNKQIDTYTVEGSEIIPYPFFVDVRKDGMNSDGVITSALEQVTLTWPSPIIIDENKNKGRHITRLLQSSPGSWTSDSGSIQPVFSDKQKTGFPEPSDRSKQLIAVAIDGCFESYFKGKPSVLSQSGNVGSKSSNASPTPANASAAPGSAGDPPSSAPAATIAPISSVIEKSPESARLVLFSSNNFLSDQVLYTISSALRTNYDAPINLMENTIDWSVADKELLSIRKPGKFARTLRTTDPVIAILFEYGNYTMAAVGLVIVWLIARHNRRKALKKYGLSFSSAAKPSPSMTGGKTP